MRYGIKRVVLIVAVLSVFDFQSFLEISSVLASTSAGLSWGPVAVGNLQFKISNVHYFLLP